MKRLVVLAALLVLTACDAPAPQAAPSASNVGAAGGAAVLDARGVGAVRLGLTSAELEATGEIGADVTTPEFSCSIRELTAASGWVGLQDGVAVEIRVDADARTPEGLRIGDSRARMREVYPDVEQYPHAFIRPLDAETGYKFVFENAGDTLTAIGLVRADRGCLT
jgi:hypothetical protein